MSMELPELEEGLLDEATLRQLCRDIQGFAQLDQVLGKGGARSRAPDGSLPLDQALEDLTSGRLMGLQLRYRYQGAGWFDTILRTPAGFKVVRMKQPT